MRYYTRHHVVDPGERAASIATCEAKPWLREWYYEKIWMLIYVQLLREFAYQIEMDMDS